MAIHCLTYSVEKIEFMHVLLSGRKRKIHVYVDERLIENVLYSDLKKAIKLADQKSWKTIILCQYQSSLLAYNRDQYRNLARYKGKGIVLKTL